MGVTIFVVLVGFVISQSTTVSAKIPLLSYLQTCKTTVSGTTFTGTVSETKTGKTCQRWDSQVPHQHNWAAPTNFPDDFPFTISNNCRNPDGKAGGPWCYTTDIATVWEYCDIPACMCKTSKFGKTFVGEISHTAKGHTCQRWDTQSPHQHPLNDDFNFPDGSVKNASNFCRNPDGQPGGPWCFTTDPNTTFEFCDVPLCFSVCKNSQLGEEFEAPLSETKTGTECQRWDAQIPHTHNTTTLADARNYCRNPDGMRPDGPWCYTTDLFSVWEYCDVPFCKLCKNSRLGERFAGDLNVTAKGMTCERWDALAPHSNTWNNRRLFPDLSLEDASNFCRNPDGKPGGPWCYTNGPDCAWEYCDIPGCMCKTTAMGKEYVGELSHTFHERICQRWDAQFPHKHTTPNDFPDSSMEAASNFCRNPKNKPGGPWCYTTDPDTKWEYCSVRLCYCKTSQLGKDFTALLSETKTKKECQRWDTQTPHKHTRNDPALFPDSTLTAASNYCRNPDDSPNGPWCYTTEAGTRWEYCDVPFCRKNI